MKPLITEGDVALLHDNTVWLKEEISRIEEQNLSWELASELIVGWQKRLHAALTELTSYMEQNILPLEANKVTTPRHDTVVSLQELFELVASVQQDVLTYTWGVWKNLLTNTEISESVRVYAVQEILTKYPKELLMVYTAVDTIMQIPYTKMENEDIPSNFLSSAEDIREKWEVFYMNSCFPRTLLLMENLNNLKMFPNAELLIDIYTPIRDDYDGDAWKGTPTLHACISFSDEQQQERTCQFFGRARHITKWAYKNPEPNIDRVLLEPIKMPIWSILSTDTLKDVLEKWETIEPLLTHITKSFDVMMAGLVQRLQASNTEEEFAKDHNQKFISSTPVYITL